MPNILSCFNFVSKDGDTMTGSLDMGLNEILLTNGINGGRIRGHPLNPDVVQVRTRGGGGHGSVDMYRASVYENVVMQADRTVDGVDISADLYHIGMDGGGPASHTGDTNETTLKFYTVLGGTLGTIGAIRIKATGVSVGVFGNKTYRLKFGGVTIGALTQAPDVVTLNWTLWAAIHNVGAVDNQATSHFWVDESTIKFNRAGGGAGVDTSVDQTIEITVQLGHPDDEGKVYDFTIEINPTT